MQVSVPQSVPPAVPSAINSVPVLTQPQLGPYTPPTGSSTAPQVPRTFVPGDEHIPGSPRAGNTGSTGSAPFSGSAGAPTVPTDGFLWKPGPIDDHYRSGFMAGNPNAKVNNPPTSGMFTWVKTFVNGIFLGDQNVDTTGFQAREAQQRTSFMRVTPPPHGGGYAPETYVPRQQPQQANTYKIVKATGTSPYGSGVLNSDNLGAGQVAGGIGGNLYTPSVGQSPPTSAVGPSNPGGMPTWG